MERLVATLEATAVVEKGTVNHPVTAPGDSTVKLELRSVALVDEKPPTLRAATLEAYINTDTYSVMRDVLQSPLGRVRMRFEFYEEIE